ncbi:hypothetical protein HPB50_024231 [Hyalomma asiaticum]|uniref:Uncharacterized protein n=1 Tax=Hyalomma asiaticum TaxID=266040 RepID=A0ACB7SGY1_HYAAI|nr:hypothetical protein HPB50_024231 [Hyalomma asiaticum]
MNCLLIHHDYFLFILTQHSATGATVDADSEADSSTRRLARPESQWSTLYSLVVAGVVELSLILAVVYVRRTGGRNDARFHLSSGDLRVVTPYTNHTTAADVPDLCGAIPR